MRHSRRIVTSLIDLLVSAHIGGLAQRLPIIVSTCNPVVLMVHRIVLTLELLV